MVFISTFIFVCLFKASYQSSWITFYLLLFIVDIKVKLKCTLNFIHFQSREHFCYSVEYIGCIYPEYFK